MTLLLQSPIRCCDKPAAGGLARQTFDVLHEYASDPPGSARRSHDAAGRFRHEQSCRPVTLLLPAEFRLPLVYSAYFGTGMVLAGEAGTVDWRVNSSE
jgi:hypothetical protein